MPKVVNVTESLDADGKTRYYVMLQQEDGATSRVEVGKAEADRFRAAMRGQPRLLTEA